MCMNHINKSNFIRAKFTQRTLKNLSNHLTPFKCHFGRLIKMVAPFAKIKQVFKVEKLIPQQEETIKGLNQIKQLTLTSTISVIKNKL